MPKTNPERALDGIHQGVTAVKNNLNDFTSKFEDKYKTDIKNGYFGNVTLTIQQIKVRLLDGEYKITQNIKINTTKKNLDKAISGLAEDLQDVVRNHQKLAEETSHLKNPTVVQTIKNYLQKAADLISKLFAAIANFFTQTLPNKASEVKASLTTCFSKFKTAEENIATSNNDSQKTRPSN